MTTNQVMVSLRLEFYTYLSLHSWMSESCGASDILLTSVHYRISDT